MFDAVNWQSIVTYCEKVAPQTANMTGRQASIARQSVVASLTHRAETVAILNVKQANL